MVAFNFKPSFVDPILTGTKVQTIRATRRCNPGDPMHFYTGLRTKACKMFALRQAVVMDYCHVAPEGLTLGDIRKHPRDRDEFARLDGFADYAAMLAWFQAQYGSPRFIGTVHRWVAQSGASDAG